MSDSTEQLLGRIAAVRGEALQELARAGDVQTVETCRVKYLGRKGVVTALFKELGGVEPDRRREIGQQLNALKQDVERQTGELRAHFETTLRSQRLRTESVDVTLPGRRPRAGFIHPLRQTLTQVVDIFTGLGFSLYEGPEIETDWYNFEEIGRGVV